MNEYIKALNANSAVEAMKYMKESRGAVYNLIIADNQGKNGNIAFVSPGSYPKRRIGLFGNRISRGWVAENEWDGYLSSEEKPYLLNPEKGYIVTANNPITTPYTKTFIN